MFINLSKCTEFYYINFIITYKSTSKMVFWFLGDQFVFDWCYILVVIYNYIMGKRGPQSKFTDVACPNEAYKDHGVTGHGNIAGCDSTNTFYYNFRKDESTIDLALSIPIKGMSNEATADVLNIQPATLKRWLGRAAE